MYSLILMSCVLIQAFAWEQLPNIPSGRRSQFYILQNDGSYKYGYDVGDGNAAKQSADPSNQVEGHYFYTNPLGQKLDLQYSAGTQGFVPVGLEKILQSSHPTNAGPYWVANPHLQNYANSVPPTFTQSSDGSYSFGYTSDSQERSEQSDANGNIRGRYSYKSPVGTHDLSYVAGSSTGFLPTGGSLIVPPGVTNAQLKQGATGKFELDEEAENEEPQQPNNPQPPINHQPDHSDDESGGDDDDNSGEYKPDNMGEYVPDNSGEYIPDNSGEYQPGSEETDESDGSENSELKSSETSGDASYNFKIDTAEYKRTESADSNGNVQGRFSYSNNQGTHDLQYEAGAEKGFIAKSGSLSVPNGLINGHQPWQALKNVQNSAPSTLVQSNDGSYSFGFSTDDQDRTEQGDSNGNVRGRYSYKNAAGTHDLNYVAGSATGFLPTGGSLVQAPGLTHDQLRSPSIGPVVVNHNAAVARLQNIPASGPGNFKLVSYLPSKINKDKYGYIFETN